MIKLIATDIDGTLVDEGSNKVNAKYHEAVRELKKMGITFVVATGRSFSSVYDLFNEVKDDIIICCENGAFVSVRNKTIAQHILQENHVRDIIKDLREIRGVVPCVSKPYEMLIEDADKKLMDSMNKDYKLNARLVNDILEEDLTEIIKVSAIDELGVTQNSGPIMRKKWGETLLVKESGFNWLDLNAENITKGKSIADIKEFLGVSYDETMVFGDNQNDIEMLKEAKYSYAVANAREEVKAAANFVTLSQDEDGVLRILEKVIRGDKDFASLD